MDVKIGMDVELAFTESVNGRFVRADSVIEVSTKKKFGTDGCPSIAEIRVKEHEIPSRLIFSIKSIMRKAIKRYPRLGTLRWNGGAVCSGQALGGHIHFGTGRSPKDLTLHYLDTLLATFVWIMDDGVATRERMSHGYGYRTSARNQPWGWEYRTLPSFITDKDITRGVLELAKVIVEHVEYDVLSEEEIHAFNIVRLTDTEYRRIEQGDKSVLSTKMARRIAFIKEYLVKSKDYQKINVVFRRAKMALEGKYSLNHKDLKETWQLKSPVEVVTRRAIMEFSVPQTQAVQ